MKRLRGIQYTNQYCNLKDETSQATELVMWTRKVNAYIFCICPRMKWGR
jgi:hypothetical protein